MDEVWFLADDCCEGACESSKLILKKRGVVSAESNQILSALKTRKRIGLRRTHEDERWFARGGCGCGNTHLLTRGARGW